MRARTHRDVRTAARRLTRDEYDALKDWSSEELSSSSEPATPSLKRPRPSDDLLLALDARKSKLARRDGSQSVDQFAEYMLSVGTVPALRQLYTSSSSKSREARIPLNDGTFMTVAELDEQRAFTNKWIESVNLKRAQLAQNPWFDLLTQVAAILGLSSPEDLLDESALDEFERTTREGMRREVKDSDRLIVSALDKEKQRNLLISLLEEEKEGYVSANRAFEQVQPLRPLAEALNSLYTLFEKREDDKRRVPVLAPRRGAHVIEELARDHDLFILLSANKSVGEWKRLARNADARRIAGRSPLNKALLDVFNKDMAEEKIPETWPYLYTEFRNIYRRAYIQAYHHNELDVNYMYPGDMHPLTHVFAAFAWLSTRSDPALSKDVRDVYTVVVDQSTKMWEIDGERNVKSLYEMAQDREDANKLVPDYVNIESDLAKLLQAYEKIKRDLLLRVYVQMLPLYDTANDDDDDGDVGSSIIQQLRRDNGGVGGDGNGEDEEEEEDEESRVPVIDAVDQTLVAALEGTANEPGVSELKHAMEVLEEWKLNADAMQAIEGLDARLAVLAQSTYPFSFVRTESRADFREHLYYVTHEKDAAAFADLSVPASQISSQTIRADLKSQQRQQDDEPRRGELEAPTVRIDRVYARANRRAFDAISDMESYPKASEAPRVAPYLMKEQPSTILAVLLVEAYKMAVYEREHALARVQELTTDILRVEGIIANIATERPSLPSQDQLLKKYMPPSRKGALWRMRPEISGMFLISPVVKHQIEETLAQVRRTSRKPGFNTLKIVEFLLPENRDFRIAFGTCVGLLALKRGLIAPNALPLSQTPGQVNQQLQAAFRAIAQFSAVRTRVPDSEPPEYYNVWVPVERQRRGPIRLPY